MRAPNPILTGCGRLAKLIGTVFLEVKRALAGAQVEVGATYVITEGETTVGRSSSADIVLVDPRVSRRHARFLLGSDGLFIQNLSRHGTFVNEEEVDGQVRLAARDWIQIGGVLLRVREPETQPLDGLMRILRSSSDEPPEPGRSEGVGPVLRLSTGTLEVWFLGQPIALRPLLFRTLAYLVEQAGQWVRTEDLAASIWPDDHRVDIGYVNKHVSYVRSALQAVLEPDSEGQRRLRDALYDGADRFTRVDDLPDLDARGLLRELLKARKKVGFRLALDPRDAVLAD